MTLGHCIIFPVNQTLQGQYMYFNKPRYSAISFALLSALGSITSYAGGMGPVNSFFKGHFLAEIGGYSAVQGKAQHINLGENLIGNQYTLKSRSQGGGLVGLGYLLDGPIIAGRYPLSYGINAFFLGQTAIEGTIRQENLFENLSYRYNIRNIPVYFTAKTIIDTKFEPIKLAVDAGIGPNFMKVSDYREAALIEGSIPDNAFSDHNNAVFAATIGVNLRFNNNPKSASLECGYRFFYLGQGQLAVNNHQVLNALKTGNTYANALVFSVVI